MKFYVTSITSQALVLFIVIFGFTFTTNAQTVYKANLSGSQEVPPVTSTGSGEVTATLEGDSLFVEGTFSNLRSPVNTDIGAHIHMALPGRNGPVTHPLEFDLNGDGTSGSFSAEVNRFELDENELALLESRRLYINVHTNEFPAGEIRGQLLPEADAYFRTNLSGTSEVPPVLTQANGAVTLELDGDSLRVTGSFQNLSDDFSGAHIHLAPAGRNGGVEIPLTVVIDDMDNGNGDRSGIFPVGENAFSLSQEQITNLEDRRFYINVHSDEHPGGEIRGQIVRQGTNTLVANITGSEETPGIISDGSGAIIAELDGDSIAITGSFQDLGSDYTNSHIHVALPGRSGGVTIPLQPDIDQEDNTMGVFLAQNNTSEVNEEQVEQLMNRELYINIHSDEHGPGEIRGQLLGESYAFFAATFDGINEVPPVSSAGTGAAAVEFKGNRLVLIGAFDNLSAPVTAAHFHTGAPYESGGVILGVHIAPDEGDSSGVFDFANNHYGYGEDADYNDDFIEHLFNENLYLNIHSEQFGPGELRGQVLAAPNAFPEVAELHMPDDDAHIVIAGDSTETFDVSWTDAEDPDGNTVVYIWQGSLDSDFSELIFNDNEGTESQIVVTYADAEQFLDDQGIGVGESLTLYHRIVASDGSLHRISESRSFTLERGTFTSAGQPDEIPHVTRLEQNYPNPFNPATEITFAVSDEGPVELTVYNMIGQRVAVLVSTDLSPGEHSVRFDAANLSSGVYIYRLHTNGQTISRKMTLIK